MPAVVQPLALGLVEPLGFAICSLPSKREAVGDIDGSGSFKLVHDTFHHHLAGGPEIFPELTCRVHISGVTEGGRVGDMSDPNRVLVDEEDRIDNVGQLGALRAAGYAGPLPFEPFAPAVHALTDPIEALSRSMAS
jgi:2-keto-myo-inositol isomerase